MPPIKQPKRGRRVTCALPLRCDRPCRERKRAAARRYSCARRKPKQPPPLIPLPGEELHPVPGYRGLYGASSLGRVRSDRGGKGTHVGKVLKSGTNFSGCPTVGLCRGGRLRTFLASRVIAAA